MTNLYIQVENNIPINHPALEVNLMEVYGEIPSSWVPFTKSVRPEVGVYEKQDTQYGPNGCEYQATSNGFKDVWHIMDMSIEEKTSKINAAKLDLPNFITTWLFDELTCQWKPPVNYPISDSVEQQSMYKWRDSDASWVEVVGTSPSGEAYYFNVSSESWVLMPDKPALTGYIFNEQTGEWVAD